MTNLPTLTDLREQVTVVLSNHLTVTFVYRMIEPDQYDKIVQAGADRRYAIALEEWREQVAGLDEAERPDPPARGPVTFGDIRADVLAAGITSFYSNVESAPKEFTREDAEALDSGASGWPDWAIDTVFNAVNSWATKAAPPDPFGQRRTRN